MGAGISSTASENDDCWGSLSLPSKTGLDDVPENCISSLLMSLDPQEICKLARVNKAFHRASSADFLWESKLPPGYKFLVNKVLGEEKLGSMTKKEIYAKLCQPNFFDGGAKEIWLDRCSAQVCLLISPRSLKITGIDDRRYWNYIPTEESRHGSRTRFTQCPIRNPIKRITVYILHNQRSISLTFQGSDIWNMSEVKNNVDFIQLLEPDMSIKILNHLDDPCDLVRVSIVSSSWHRFVIENGLCKRLCLRMFPEISHVAHSIELGNMIEPVCNVLDNWECLKRNHKVYAFLASGLTPTWKNCISEAISASSTDNYPEESIQNTLEPRDRTENRLLYWSSKGESDPSVPETLGYKLISKLCLVTEIHVQPFQAYFQHGFPIYSAKAVRFRMGHPRYPMELESSVADDMAANRMLGDSQFIWTYTSPEFPMFQENRLQKFKLPEPVLSIGGVLLVELLGRVQKQEMDELFYICISHVQVVGQPLSPAFDIKIHHPSGKCTLKYFPQTDWCVPSTSSPTIESNNPSRLRSLMQSGVRRWEQIILGALLGSGSVAVDD